MGIMQKRYPQNPKEWREATEYGLGLTPPEAQDAYRAGAFPVEQLELWLQSTYQQGYSSEFLPALQRNIKGLVAWAYGNENEPYWPGSDDDQKANRINLKEKRIP
jgi:hypothetical protein